MPRLARLRRLAEVEVAGVDGRPAVADRHLAEERGADVRRDQVAPGDDRVHEARARGGHPLVRALVLDGQVQAVGPSLGVAVAPVLAPGDADERLQPGALGDLHGVPGARADVPVGPPFPHGQVEPALLETRVQRVTAHLVLGHPAQLGALGIGDGGQLHVRIGDDGGVLLELVELVHGLIVGRIGCLECRSPR